MGGSAIIISVMGKAYKVYSKDKNCRTQISWFPKNEVGLQNAAREAEYTGTPVWCSEYTDEPCWEWHRPEQGQKGDEFICDPSMEEDEAGDFVSPTHEDCGYFGYAGLCED